MLRKDINGNVIPSGSSFLTAEISLPDTSFLEVDVPDGAAEFMIDADGITLMENSTASGFSLASYLPIGVSQKSKIGFKHAEAVEFSIIWILA